MVRFILAAIVAMGTALPVGANDLYQLYQLALTRDATLQAAGFERDAAIEARPQAFAQFLPQLAASASAARERATYQSSQIGNVGSVDCTTYADMQRCFGNTRGLGLNLSQTLWSFQAFNQLKEAHSLAASAEATFRGAQENLLLRVATAYFAILSASDRLATSRSERQAFGTLLNQAKAREQTGVGPRSDVEQAQAFYDATEQSVIDAQNALDDANLDLTEIVGPHAGDVAPLREDIPLAAPEPESADEWVAAARQDNFDLRAAALQVEAASRDISVQQSKGLPTVALTGSSSRLTQDELLGGNQTIDTIGVSFSWPLIQGGAVASAVRQSRARYRKAQALYDSAQRDSERLTRAAFRGVVTGVQRIAAARRAMNSRREAVEASRRNVEFGTGNEFDLLNAQNNYYASQRAYSQARYDYVTNVLTLKQLAGRLSERDLVAIDDLLVESRS